ncbi:hypothetical protein H4J38_12815 [Colwellia sp. BRX10-3]|uniref:TapY2 family type IVa secretion system protein n=1 Tax=Colwellia sp. BRX10-3 TaxID=2759844 RepID=UPI0015F4562F|nr:TapY2 family type IVa secretion system protein [Colwellia sp. BRX10-3]MBA6391650.1 hypothetical protein [Colwellia sp. BRX10-3]
MKNKIFFITLIVLINTSFNASAANKVEKKHKVDAKCHVELADGKQVIYFATVKENRINKLIDTLVNRKIPTPFTSKKQQVKRAFECVLLDAKFNSAQANQLFDKQPR